MCLNWIGIDETQLCCLSLPTWPMALPADRMWIVTKKLGVSETKMWQSSVSNCCITGVGRIKMGSWLQGPLFEAMLHTQPAALSGGDVAQFGWASDWHAAEAGLIPRGNKGFFSQSQLSVHSLFWCPYSLHVQLHALTPVCMSGQRSQALAAIPLFYHHHHHLSQNHEGRWGTTDDFTTNFLYFSTFSTALWDLANSKPVHSLMSSHLFLCLPCLLPPFTVPGKMVLARPDEQETCPYHFSLRLFTMVRSPRGPTVCWILPQSYTLHSKVHMAKSQVDFKYKVLDQNILCSFQCNWQTLIKGETWLFSFRRKFSEVLSTVWWDLECATLFLHIHRGPPDPWLLMKEVALTVKAHHNWVSQRG